MTKRRRFLALVGGALTSTIVLAGCLGNPPTSTDAGGSAPTSQAPAAGNTDLEVKTVSLGFIPILEAAPLVIGVEKGFFARHGLEVNLSKQASWPAARDNVVLGTAGGGIEGGQWQLPMPQMISEGAITDGKKVPMYILAMLMSQGQGLAASNSVKDANLGTDLKPAASFIKDFPQTEKRKFRAAYTFPKANQDMWIRYWLAAGGIDPDKDVELLTVPSTETVQGMRNGTMELFSTGDPWPTRVVNDKIGYLATTTAYLWPVHPEEFLAVRADWVDKNPKATIALIKGVIEAQQWLDKPENKIEAAKILSSRKWYNIPQPVLELALKGGYKPGTTPTPETDPKNAPLYWNSDRGVISYPYKSLTLWFLLESMRWKFYPDTVGSIEQAKAINDKVTREDLWRQAAQELGLPAADIPTTSSRGKETFFDGVVYDPEKPQAYLDSVKIKR
ncbi:CmpA/NrtA family ABC transporter substrate-binding protein [Synechococcus sp. CCY 0621]|uniref:CmpA/NrtA family ABC transporter substrate-binding protein n=1 Tax=Synechococcus sp. CCY 0621 TaxID=2815603 RepID=UPI001C23591A|nr:CmpA/NrtA family ABC transporter substrate-binding protein [Synechococcus sp. CCY 0621]